MRNLSKPQRLGLFVALVVVIGGLGIWLFSRSAPPPPQDDSTAVILKQSQALREMALRTETLGIAREDISWEGQKPSSLAQIYQDLWPLTPPSFANTPPLTWQMGWAGEHLVFFLDGLPAEVCQSLNKALKVMDQIPESPWSKQDLLRRKATLPPLQGFQDLQTRGCVKTIFATYLYYDIL